MKSIPHKVFEYLLKHPRSSGPEIAAAIHERYSSVGNALKTLRRKGAVDRLDIRVGNRWEWVITADASPDFRRKILSQRPQGWGTHPQPPRRKPTPHCPGDNGKTLAELLGYGL